MPRQSATGTGPQRLGASIAGEPTVGAQQTLTNQAVTDTLAHHEAEVPHDQELNYQTVAAARKAGPGAVYDAAHNAMPEQLTQDEQLQNAIKTIGDSTSQLPRSPDVDALKQTMLNAPDMTRDQLFANIEQARDRASHFSASDQPDAKAMGQAYQQLANAYEEFVGRQLQATPGAPVSLTDWQNARVRFAKNYAVQNALQGTSVNASKYGAMQKANPEQLTGPSQLIAEQANRFPLSSGFGPRTYEPGGIGASGSIEGGVARSMIGPAIGGATGAYDREALSGVI